MDIKVPALPCYLSPPKNLAWQKRCISFYQYCSALHKKLLRSLVATKLAIISLDSFVVNNNYYAM